MVEVVVGDAAKERVPVGDAGDARQLIRASGPGVGCASFTHVGRQRFALDEAQGREQALVLRRLPEQAACVAA